jgi:mono/diheme cytochrome c family protein
MNRRKTALTALATITSLLAACSQKVTVGSPGLNPSGFGAAIVESSGGKQVAPTGATLAQPVVVQVNDDQGNAVGGALVQFRGPSGLSFDPSSGLTDSSGQVSTNVGLGGQGGRYQITATTLSKAQKALELKIEEIALDYQGVLGRQLNEQYCSRCHDPESTPERVSNFDNLEIKPHAFTEGDTLNKMTEADLIAVIGHGGPALNKSPLMPPYGYTLSKADIQALVAYIRAVSDPPYRAPGTVYAKK